MRRARRIRLADHRGRDATVLLIPLNHGEKRQYQNLAGEGVQNRRRVKATASTCCDALLARHSDPEELARVLLEADPELDLETAGRVTGPCDRVHLDGDGNILFAPSFVEVRCGPDGLEQERRPWTPRSSNLVTPAAPVWSGVLMDRGEAGRRHALTRAFQVRHTNALEFDFLYGLAKHLDSRGALVQVGSGNRGTGPLILERGGTAHRAFLDGRVQDNAMCLLLYASPFPLEAQEVTRA